jgi:hypothetical protein
MASFYRRASDERSLRTVPEEAGGTGSSRTGSGAGKIGGAAAASGEGQGTPTNGSELGVRGMLSQWLVIIQAVDLTLVPYTVCREGLAVHIVCHCTATQPRVQPSDQQALVAAHNLPLVIAGC